MPSRPPQSDVSTMRAAQTLGCWPITAAELSGATTLGEVVQETLTASRSERAGRLIDHDEAGAMEKKKHEGYF